MTKVNWRAARINKLKKYIAGKLPKQHFQCLIGNFVLLEFLCIKSGPTIFHINLGNATFISSS